MFAYDPRFNDRDYCKTQVGAGWAGLVDRCFDLCEAAGVPFNVIQVKEKFGGLRFYVGLTGDNIPTGAYDTLSTAIVAVEDQSYAVCEECGAPGTLDNSKAWIRTLCSVHRAERG